MFDSLSDRLGSVFDRLRGRGALTEADVCLFTTLFRFDLSAVKRLQIKGRVNAEFRAEFLNAFNTPWFTPVLGIGNDPDDYRVTGVTGGAREVQLVWRLNW